MFKSTAVEPKQSVPSVGKSTATADKTTKSDYLVGRLSKEQMQFGEEIVRRSVDKTGKSTYSLEQYAKDLEKMGRLK
jgi:hypothetical protein